jgi:murein DD-endopeptidase MepM/ murein hydrolase activator NlpD
VRTVNGHRAAHRRPRGRVTRLRPPIAGLLVAASVTVATLAGAGPSGASSGSGVGTDRAKIAALEAKIAAQGSAAQTVVSEYNAVETRLLGIDHAIALEKAKLAADERSEHIATTRLRSVAVNAYVNAVFGNSLKVTTFTGTGTASLVQVKNVYLGVANGSLSSALTNLQVDQQQVSEIESTLAAEQRTTAADLQQLSAAHAAAERAIGASESTLSQVHGNLQKLIAAAEARRAAAREEAAEAAIAAAAAQSEAAAPPAPTTDAAPAPVAGKYENPLRGMAGLESERIDQGVDFGGWGPIYAVGDGVVISTVSGGWPGGAFISYRLTDGPAAGLVVYAAEDIEPTVQIGQTVTADTVIGHVYEGYYGIETGWADGRGDGTTLAADNGFYYGSSAFGYNFSQLLRSLGAPGGILEDGPNGTLPAGWPQW